MLAHSWLNPKFEVRVAGGKGGHGVFANHPVTAGERLAIFGGHVINVSEEQVNSDGSKDLCIQISEEFVIGTKYESEIEDTDFFNHSCDPNAGLKGQIFLVAMRNIEVDEEVTFDYAMVLHKAEGVEAYKMSCMCGSPNCRGLITEEDWKIPELQKKYDGYFSWYLQEKIDGIKKTRKGSANKWR
jgi:SET domain-containing protein